MGTIANEDVGALIGLITALTTKFPYPLRWARFSDGVYFAEDLDVRCKFLFFHRHSMYELFAADDTHVHDPLVIVPVLQGRDFLEEFERLEVGIRSQIDTYVPGNSGQKVFTEGDYIRYLSRNMF